MPKGYYNVRVELKQIDPDDSDKNLRVLYSIFERKVNESGVLKKWKEHQSFESKSQKRRRKRKESAYEFKRNNNNSQR